MTTHTSSTPARGDLVDASLEALLRHALMLDDDDGDPALHILDGVGLELGLLASLLEISQPGGEFNSAELAPVLESLERRVNVTVELLKRTRVAAGEKDAEQCP